MRVKSFERWGVYICDHEASRRRNPHLPPSDPKDQRRYVIVTSAPILKSIDRVLCVPIGEKAISAVFDIPLAVGDAGSTKACYIWSREIFTYLKGDFSKKVGHLSEEKIKLLERRLRDMLGL